MSILIDSYSETNANIFYSLNSNYSDGPPNGQTFTNLSVPMVLSSAKFYIKYGAGSPTGNVYAHLFNVAGATGNVIPTTAPTAPIAISDPISSAGVGASAALYEFFFTGSNRYLMAPNTVYGIVLNGAAVGNSSNYVVYGEDSTSPTHSGTAFFASSSTAWVPDSGEDMAFYVYGDKPSNKGALILFS